MNLIVSGSIYSLMHQIFEDRKEPLFSRAGQMIHLKPFEVEVLKEILADHNPSYRPMIFWHSMHLQGEWLGMLICL